MDTNHMSLELKTAIDAIKIGARIALSYYTQKIDIELKEDSTIVTKADRQVEAAIKGHISSVFKDAKFVGEETGGSINESEFWIIDPIDGTRSFVRKIPTWAVMVAYCQNGVIRVGAVIFPMLNTSIYAERGKGAYIDGEKVHVSSVSPLNKSYVGISQPKDFIHKEIYQKVIEASYSTRMMATYSQYLVAAGRMEAFVTEHNKIWDNAPFKVIVEEAGGKMTRLDGSPWTVEGQGAIASNGLVHDEIVRIVNK